MCLVGCEGPIFDFSTHVGNNFFNEEDPWADPGMDGMAVMTHRVVHVHAIVLPSLHFAERRQQNFPTSYIGAFAVHHR